MIILNLNFPPWFTAISYLSVRYQGWRFKTVSYGASFLAAHRSYCADDIINLSILNRPESKFLKRSHGVMFTQLHSNTFFLPHFQCGCLVYDDLTNLHTNTSLHTEKGRIYLMLANYFALLIRL